MEEQLKVAQLKAGLGKWYSTGIDLIINKGKGRKDRREKLKNI